MSLPSRAILLRPVLILLALLAFPVAVHADSLQSVAESAAQYLSDIQSQFGSSQDPAAEAANLAAANKALASGDDDGAIAAYEKAIAAGDNRPETWNQLAIIHTRLENYDHATAAAYNAFSAAASPVDKAAALARLGQILEKAEEPNLAFEAYRESVKLSPDDKVSGHLQAMLDAMTFRVIARSVAATGDQPELCLEFHGDLADTSSLHYEDYVKIAPALASPVYSVSGDKLCIGGVEFGHNYRVTVLAGLADANGDKLAGDTSVDFAVGDSEPTLGFRSATYVLPRIGSIGVPLVSVNLTKASLRLMRIGDRNIVQTIQRGIFLKAIDNYDADSIAQESGELVWTGTVDVQPERNKRVTTLIPISDMVPAIAPGVYVLIAERADGGGDKYGEKATQWLIVTDLGLTTMSGADGLNVFVRSLNSGRALDRITVKLYARNNEELASVVTDRSGLASFPPGLMRGSDGRTATALMAFRRDGDFTFLDLTRAAFDLSDRGVGGRLAPQAADAFLYADRGVYRPGETVHLGALLRDASAEALSGLPLTLKLIRPDEVEARSFTVTEQGAGGYALDIPMSASSRTGSWTVQAYLDPKGEAVGSLSFLVEDVVPARIEATLSTDAKTIKPGDPTPVALASKYLYGAPAAKLLVKGTLTVEQDSDPFLGVFPGFQFGLVDEKVDPQSEDYDDQTTDDKGDASFDMTPSDLPDTGQPLKATLHAEVYEFGGRPVIRTLSLPIRNHPLSIGLKPLFADGAVASGSDADFDIIAVDAAGNGVAASGLQYRLIPEDWDYQWFYKDGNWDYRIVTRDKPAAASGKLDIKADQPGHVSFKTDWGYYRLEVYDQASGAASSSRFYAGWGAAPGTGDTPDKLQVVADKASYAAGDTAKLLIKPPFAGEVLIAIATDHLIDSWTVDATPDGRVVEVPTDKNWGAGAYVLATAFRPGKDGDRGPGRAIGVAWLGLDPAARSLKISISPPAETRPRTAIDLPVQVDGIGGSGQAYVTIAAVDEGILQLTDFATPAPQDYYFGKRSLGLELRDLYGQLIDGRDGRRGEVRAGGDTGALAQRGAPPEIKLVALYSGVLKLDGAGKTSLHLDIPDYTGRLRIMAVAWDADKVGAGDFPLVVRDPVVATLSLPRFLAPGDKSRIAVSLQNLSGPAGDYKVTLTAAGPVTLGDGAVTTQHLDAQGTANFRVALWGNGVGDSKLRLTLLGPDGFKLEHEASLYVRAAQFPLLERSMRQLKPGESLRLDDAALARFLPETAELMASFSTLPNLDVPGLLRQLDRYPYGCIEQTTSRALPLLYVSDIAKLWGTDKEADMRARVQQAIERIFEMQRYDGGFALWDATGDAEPWLSAYAMDFLTRAKAKGYDVADVSYQNGLKWLADLAQNNPDDTSDIMAARAYALYVLAEAGAENLSALRYMADNQLDSMPAAIGTAQIAAALALHGDKARAAAAFKVAMAQFDRESGQSYWFDDYGGALRDGAAILTLAVETGASGIDLTKLLERVVSLQAGSDWFSTQEQGWLVLAANAMTAQASPMTLSLDGKDQPASAKPLYLKPDAEALAKGLTVKNVGAGPVWAGVSLIGVPEQDLPAASNGYDLERNFFLPDGTAADLDHVKQSDVLIVVLKGKRKDQDPHQTLVVDLLPAGFEIENARLAGSRKTDSFAWLGDLTEPTYQEYRDDRFVAAVDLSDKDDFTLAYLVRAVTPGSYRLPGASVEDMYRPSLRARTATGQVTISAYAGASQ